VCLPEGVFDGDVCCAEVAHKRKGLLVDRLDVARSDALPDHPILALLRTAQITKHRRDVVDGVVSVERAFAKDVLQAPQGVRSAIARYRGYID
jgi:hypothetical protein